MIKCEMGIVSIEGSRALIKAELETVIQSHFQKKSFLKMRLNNVSKTQL